MKLTRVLTAAALAFLLGGSAVVFATPAAAANTPKAQCTNIGCAFNPQQGLWCQFVVGMQCSFSGAGSCVVNECS